MRKVSDVILNPATIATSTRYYTVGYYIILLYSYMAQRDVSMTYLYYSRYWTFCSTSGDWFMCNYTFNHIQNENKFLEISALIFFMTHIVHSCTTFTIYHYHFTITPLQNSFRCYWLSGLRHAMLCLFTFTPSQRQHINIAATATIEN